MRNQSLLLAWALLSVFVSCSHAQHPFTLTVASGSASLSPAPELRAEGWMVSITSSGAAATSVVLSTEETSTDLYIVAVYCGPDTTLSITEMSGGSFEFLNTVFKPQPQPDSGLFLIDEIVISGSITGGVSASSIRQIEVGGDVSGGAIIGGSYDDPLAPDGWQLEELFVGGNLEIQMIHAFRGAIGAIDVGG